MKRYSTKNKIIILVLLWLAISSAMFVYFFKILDASNQASLTAMAKDRKDLVSLQAQNKSYIQAQGDLNKLAAKPLQPDNFFTHDISLVKEIETLENLATKLGVQMKLSGVSGTIDTAQKAGTVTPLVLVPYSINLSGSLPQVVDFIESLENLSFVTNVTSLSLSAGDKGAVSAGLSASFYLRK